MYVNLVFMDENKRFSFLSVSKVTNPLKKFLNFVLFCSTFLNMTMQKNSGEYEAITSKEIQIISAFIEGGLIK